MTKLKMVSSFVGGIVVGAVALISASALYAVYSENGYITQFGYDCLMRKS